MLLVLTLYIRYWYHYQTDSKRVSVIELDVLAMVTNASNDFNTVVNILSFFKFLFDL